MIHNHDEKWKAFELLLNDPALKTDRLSLNWFCLAYKHASLQLDLYRKHIFDNTRTLLKSLPPRLLSGNSLSYQVIPMEEDVEPAFIDITVSSPLHPLKIGSLVMGSLSLECMEKAIPIFYRISLGMYHTNITMISGEKLSTARLTLGLDPSQVEVLSSALKAIDALAE